MALSALTSTMMRLPADQLVVIQSRFEHVEGGLELAQFVALMLEIITTEDDDEAAILQTVSDLCELFAQIDVNGDGSMEWDEFTGFLVEQAAAIENQGITEQYKHLETIFVQEPAAKHAVQCVRWVPQLNSLLVAVGRRVQVLEADVTATGGLVKKFELPLRDFALDNDDDPDTPAQEASHATALYLEYIESIDLIVVLRSDAYVEFIKLHSRNALNPETAAFAGMTRLAKQHYKLAWNAMGNKLLSLSNDHDVHVWDLIRDPNSGVYGLGARAPLRGHSDYVRDVVVAVTEEYRYVVSAGLDRKIYLWDALSGELRSEKTVGGSAFSCLGFDASNNFLLAATYHFTIVVWDIASELNSPLYSLTGHSCQVVGMVMLPSMFRCASLDESGEFIWWDTTRLQLNDANRLVHSFRHLDRCEVVTAVIGSSASTKSFNNAFIVGAGKKVHVFACEDTRPPESPPVAVLYNPIFAVILTIHSEDVKIWDAVKGSLQKVIHKPIESNITCATFDDRLRKLLLCDQDGGVHVLNFLNGALMKSLPPMPDRPSQLIYVEVDKMVIVVSWGGWLRVYDEDCAPEVSVVREVQAHDDDIVSAAFSRSLGVIATGDCKGTVRIWDFQLLTLLCECHHGDERVLEMTSLIFMDPWPLLAVADSQGRISVVQITETKLLSLVARGGPEVCKNDLPVAQQQRFQTESGKEDFKQHAVVCMVTDHDFAEATPTILVAGDEFGDIRCWSFADLLKQAEISPIAWEQSAPAEPTYAPRRKRILSNVLGPIQRLDLTAATPIPLVIAGIWQCHQNVMTSMCTSSNPATLITAALDGAVKVWSPGSELQGILTRGRDLDSVFRRPWHFPINFEPVKAQLGRQARKVYEEVLALRAMQAAEQHAVSDEQSQASSSLRTLNHGAPDSDSFWLTSGGLDRVLIQLSGHRTWVPSKRELAAEYTKAKLKQMARTTSKLLGEKPPRTRRRHRKAKSENWDFFADIEAPNRSLSLSSLTTSMQERKRITENDRVLDRVYSQDPNSWEVGSVNKTRVMYQNLSQEYDLVGGWGVDRNAARELRVAAYLDDLLQPSQFLSERMPGLASSLSSLREELQSQQSLAWTSMKKHTTDSRKRPKRRKIKLHSRSSVVKRRVLLTPIDAQVEEHVVWDLTSDFSTTPLQSPQLETQAWKTKVKWILKKTPDLMQASPSLGLVRQQSLSSLSSASGVFYGDASLQITNFDDIGHPDEWGDDAVDELRERAQFGAYKVSDLLALRNTCKQLDVDKHVTSRTLAESCNVRVNLQVLIMHEFIQTWPQFKQRLRRQYYTTDDPPSLVAFSELLHCLLTQLSDDDMWELHRFFMLLEYELSKKPAEYATDQEDALRRLFDLYDLDKNGAIDLDELIQGLGENRDFSADSHVPAEALQKIMDTVDKDANRQLDYEEFRNLFTEAFETT